MNTDKKEPLYKAESQRIVGSAMEVLNKIGQMMNDLRVTGVRLDYILKFKHAKLEWRRVVK
jgi:hypothetical protein